MALSGKALFVTGASRGIGKAIALRAARDGASVAVVAKTAEAHPRLPGTIFTAAAEIERAGGKALPIQCDIRDEAQVRAAIDQTAKEFGKIDIVVNNASAIHTAGTADTDIKRYDLMHSVNGRGAWMVSKLALDYLRLAENPHILNISPPLAMQERWFAPFPAYAAAKFTMSMYVLGLAGELRPQGIAVNALWPLTFIETAALRIADAGGEGTRRSRSPAIMADAAHHILSRPAAEFSGNFCLDELLLRRAGVVDFDCYNTVPGTRLEDLTPDLFLCPSQLEELARLRKQQAGPALP